MASGGKNRYIGDDNSFKNEKNALLDGNMPRPKPGKGGTFKAFVWAFLAVAIVGGAFWWLRMDPQSQGALKDAAAETINNALEKTPLAGAGDILRASPPPLPREVLNPPTEAGTLAGRSVTGTIASPVDLGQHAAYDSDRYENSSVSGRAYSPPAPGVAGGPGGNAFSPEFVPPAKEDSTVRSSYLADLAQWLASRYRPGPKGGTLAVDARNINQLCGVELAARAKGGRSALLRYAFQPSMIQGLYNLYINQFMGDLDAAARKRGLDARQNRDFHMALAGRAMLVANALDDIMEVPELGKKLGAIDAASQKAVDINSQLTNAVFELDELREAKAPQRQISATQMRVDGIAARYRRAMEEHAEAQRALANAIGGKGGRPLDDDSLLFMASWVERRRAAGENAAASLRGISEVLRDLARRCSQTEPEN